jgi:hypothetical protein
MKKTVFKSFLSRVTSGAGIVPTSTDNQQQSTTARTMFGP